MENVRKDGDIKLVTRKKKELFDASFQKKEKEKKIMAIETLINQ